MTNITPEGKLLNIIKKTQSSLRLKKELKVFTKVNILLIGLIVIILLIFLVDIFTSDYNISELDMDLTMNQEKVLPVADDFDVDVDKYMDITDTAKEPILEKDLTKDLDLLGIVSGDSNQAIIEDKTANNTYFLYRGDSFKNFTVLEIKDNEVILDYKGEKVRLHM